MRRITVSCIISALILLGLNLPAAAQNVTLELIPFTYPIQIPVSGGNFEFYVFITNNSGQSLAADFWAKLIYPDGVTERPFWGPVTEMMQPGTTGYYRSQNVPGDLPWGDYQYIVYMGVHPDSIWSGDTLTVSKAAPGGTEVWVARYGGNGWVSDHATCCILDSSGNVYVTGASMGSTANEFNIATLKYDAFGNQVWVAVYSGPGHQWDSANSLALDDFGNIYVAGWSMDSLGFFDYAVIKYDMNGSQLWIQCYNGPSNLTDGAEGLAVHAAENIYVTGLSTGIGTDYDYATIKYDSNGNQIWVARYNGTANGEDRAYALTVDSFGNIYVTGYSEEIGTSGDYTTIKYDANGNQIWMARYNGPDNEYDFGLAIALDPAGNIYVTGGSWGTNWDFATIKYDADGNQIWEARYNGPGNSGDQGQAIAVDNEGNAYVTGQSFGIGTDADYATVKYDCDGNQVWVARYSGAGNDWDKSTCIALDEDANVYVTGWSFGSGSYSDYTTIKYDSSGNQIWLAQYNGPGNGEDYAFSLALDDDANVYVTGQSFGSETHYDYATIKYSGGNLDNWMPVEATVLGQPLPQECRLEQNYPNPFNASTAISYKLQAPSHVSLRVYDTAGRLVETLVDGWRPAGVHELTWDASDLASGMYVYRIQSGDWTESGKMILLK